MKLERPRRAAGKLTVQESGFLHIPREMLTRPVFRRGQEIGEREAWVWLIAAAAVRPGKGIFGGNVGRGQIDLSIKDLSRQWGWTAFHVERFLDRLSDAGFIRLTASRLKIVDFDLMTVPEAEEPADACVELLSAFDLRALGVVDRSRARPTIPTSVRTAVEQRDGENCQYCQSKAGPFHLDHVFPWSRGGRTTSDNLVVACEVCNLSKGARTPSEWRASGS